MFIACRLGAGRALRAHEPHPRSNLPIKTTKPYGFVVFSYFFFENSPKNTDNF